ncbi:MAG: PAS domain-containing protein, partial [Planctomycetes bacterium]|nr:PAS domain-containing protein [Planctomycetota bacterium]
MTPKAVPADPFDLSRLCRYFSERSPQPMVAVEGPTHIVRYLNPAFARLAEKDSDKLIGLPFAEALPAKIGNQCLVLLDRVL